MLNYSVRIRSISDLMELRKIAQKYDFDGKIEQNGFNNDIKKVLGSIMYLPLDFANIRVYGYEPEDEEDISKALCKFAA